MSFGYGFGPRARRRGVIAGGGGEPLPPSSDVLFVGVATSAYTDVDQHTLTVPVGTLPGDELVLIKSGAVTDDPTTPLAAYPPTPAGWFSHAGSIRTGSGAVWQLADVTTAPDPVPTSVVVGEEAVDYRGPWMAALLVYRNARLVGAGPGPSIGNWFGGTGLNTWPLDAPDGVALDVIATSAFGSPTWSTSPATVNRVAVSRLLAAERASDFGVLTVTPSETTTGGLLRRHHLIPASKFARVRHSTRRLPVVTGQLGVIGRWSRGSMPADPAGWTRVVDVLSGTGSLHVQFRAWAKVLDGTESPALVFGRGNTDEVAYFTIDTDATVLDLVQASVVGSLVAPSVDAPRPGTLLSFASRREGVFGEGSAPAGTYGALHKTSTGASTDGAVAALDRIVEAGATGDRTFVSTSGHASRFVAANLFVPDDLGPPAVQLVGSSSSDLSAPSSSATANVPAGTNDGDLMVAQVLHRNISGPTVPSGWTLLRQDKTDGFDQWQVIYTRVADDEPASYTWSNGGVRCAVGITSLRHTEGASVVEDDAGRSAAVDAAEHDSPAVTSPGAGRMLLLFVNCVFGGGTASWTLPSEPLYGGASAHRMAARYESVEAAVDIVRSITHDGSDNHNSSTAALIIGPAVP